jgi:hypothetical protein
MISEPGDEMAVSTSSTSQSVSRDGKVIETIAPHRGFYGSAKDLEVTFEVYRSGTRDAKLLNFEDFPKLYEGDILKFRLANRGAQALDVFVLFINADGGVDCWFPHSPASEVSRLARGETVASELHITSDLAGVEYLVFLAASVAHDTPPLDFCGPIEEGVRDAGKPAQVTTDEVVLTAVSQVAAILASERKRSLSNLGMPGAPAPMPITARSFRWTTMPEAN